MARSRNPDCHYETVERLGVEVELKELKPGGNYYVEHRHFGERDRKSTRTKDLSKARTYAAELCKEIALRKEGGALGAAARSSDLTLGELFDAFRERGLPKVKKENTYTHYRRYLTAMRLLEAVWGRQLRLDHLDQQRIEEFVEHREERGLEVSVNSETRMFAPVSRRTTLADLHCLSAITKWGLKQRHEGDWLLSGVNPLDRVELPPEKSNSEISRPMADQERFEAVLEFAGEIGTAARSKGRHMLPVLLQMSRHTGRRHQAIRNLCWEDICLEREACEEALRIDQAPVKRARHWPYGAIHWLPQFNKRGYETVIPINEMLHRLLRDYRDNAWPRLMSMIAGDDWQDRYEPAEMPLFPSPQDPTEAISSGTPHKWLKKAQKLAREAGRRGAPRADEEQGGFHAYRRFWANERSHFTSDADRKAVRIAGSWKPKGDVMSRVYLSISARALYRVVANEKPESEDGGIIDLRTVGAMLDIVLRNVSSEEASEQLTEFSDLSPEERERVIWDLVRDAESLEETTSEAGGDDPVSQEVVTPIRKAG